MLVAGLAGGGVLAWRFGRGGREPASGDADLKAQDLEERRDELYERLRHADELDDDERRRLELQAARVLKELDALRAAGKGSGRARAGKKKGSKKKEPGRDQPAPAAAPGQGARHPLLVGFLLGAGLASLVGILIFWAGRDAQPKATQAPAAAAPQGQPPAFDRGEPPLPPQVAAQVAELESRIAATPEDLSLHKQLAELLVAHGQFFAAFQQAQAILALDPEDPDGNYTAALVRLTMGQADAAMDHFDRALASAPDHYQSSMMKGLVLLRSGSREEAIATWRSGLEALGGRNPSLEHVLRLAEEGRTTEEILSNPPPG